MPYIYSHVTAKSHDKGHYTGRRGVSNSDVHSLFQNSYNNKIANTLSIYYGVGTTSTYSATHFIHILSSHKPAKWDLLFPPVSG